MEIIMRILMEWLKIILSKVKIADKIREKVHVTDHASDGHVNTKVRREIARGVREFMEKNYELRYNIMKQTEEFRKKATNENYSMSNSHQKATNENYSMSNSENNATNSVEKAGKWQQLTDRELRRIALEQMEQVGVAWSIDVELYVHSSLVRDYNPVADFLGGCPPWDGCDRIRPLACRVPTLCGDWPEWFHRWFLAMVAQWQQRSRDYGNGVVPMLIGSQGTHKSTFCKLLLPPSLREYYIDDIKLDNAEQVERMLGRMLLVNIDEYNAKTEREQAKIKRVLTERDVQTRKMRSDQYVMLPRMASFIATTNDQQPLCDPTGSRRYLCCELTGIIDTDTPIEYAQLYAQAVHELEAGVPWHFTKDEEADIELHNQQYRCLPAAETVLMAYYVPAERSVDNFIKAVDILQTLRQHLRPTDVPSMKKLTTALKSCRFPYGRVDGQRGWYAHRR
jgi:predicted P-loop ATPase